MYISWLRTKKDKRKESNVAFMELEKRMIKPVEKNCGEYYKSIELN